jgi:hypothetical protein
MKFTIVLDNQVPVLGPERWLAEIVRSSANESDAGAVADGWFASSFKVLIVFSLTPIFRLAFPNPATYP